MPRPSKSLAARGPLSPGIAGPGRSAALDRAFGPLVALLAGLLAVLLLLGGPAGPALAAGGGGDGGATAEGEPPSLSEPELRYEMPTLYVMLAPEDGRLPARLEIGLTVELNEAGAAELIRSHQPIITDGVWRAAARMQPSALATAAGMDQLRAELMRIISGAVGYGQVRDIYFREFLTRQPI